jgi:3-dehydroquinate dehydratase-2
MKKIAILNGPNLNRLGKREPEIYGSTTLAELQQELESAAKAASVELHFFQSNHEGALIDEIYRLSDNGFSAGIINPGGLTHTSVALRDALAGSGMDWIEVHISNIHQRESFRHTSLTSAVCRGQVSGLGIQGYHAALQSLMAQG